MEILQFQKVKKYSVVQENTFNKQIGKNLKTLTVNSRQKSLSKINQNSNNPLTNSQKSNIRKNILAGSNDFANCGNVLVKGNEYAKKLKESKLSTLVTDKIVENMPKAHTRVVSPGGINTKSGGLFPINNFHKAIQKSKYNSNAHSARLDYKRGTSKIIQSKK